MLKTVTVLCPVYKEEAGIQAFHRRLRAALSPLRERYEIRVVYALDPSPDATERELLAIGTEDPTVEILVMSRRFGHQAALLAGMDASEADALVMLDSDGQHPPELIPELLARWEGGADIVQTLRADADQAGWFKRKTSGLFYRVLRRVSSIELKSGAADFRLLARNVLHVFRSDLKEQNPFVRGLVSWVGFNICYIPFEPERRAAGTTNYRLSTLLNFAIAGVCSFSKAPLRACATLGLAFAGSGLLAGIGLILAVLLRAIDLPGWAPVLAGFSFIGGLQLFFLGVLGEYVGLILDEVKARPRYLLQRRFRDGQDVGLAPSAKQKASR